MSTRSSIWLGESEGKSVHIYWELAEREIEGGRCVAAPVYMAIDGGDSRQEITVRLPKETAEALLRGFNPNVRESFKVL